MYSSRMCTDRGSRHLGLGEGDFGSASSLRTRNPSQTRHPPILRPNTLPLRKDTHPPQIKHPPPDQTPPRSDPFPVDKMNDTRLWEQYLPPYFVCGRYLQNVSWIPKATVQRRLLKNNRIPNVKIVKNLSPVRASLHIYNVLTKGIQHKSMVKFVWKVEGCTSWSIHSIASY